MNYATDRRNSDLKDSANRKRLFDYLQDLDTNLTTEGVIGTLMQEEYAKVGLSSFLFLAGLRLAIYQEMAGVDPQNEDPDLNPAGSRRYAEPETGIVATHAKEYAEHVEKWWPKIVEDRRRAVVCQRSPAHAFGIYPEQCWVNDEFTGQDNIFTSSASIIYGKSSVDVQAECIEYKEKMVKKLEERFSHPEEIAANWRKLIVTPINTAVDTPINTAVDTPINTAVDTPINTAADTPINTAVDTPSNTAVDTPINIAVDTPSNTAVDTPSNTAVDTPSNTAVDTPSNTAVDTPSNTVADTPSNTAVNTPSNTAADTPSNTAVDTPSNTAVDTPSNTAVDTPSNTAADTPSNTTVDTPSNTAVDTPSNTAVDTPSNTAVDTPSNTAVDVGSG
ncbi:uncharacterized protein LOC118431282 [Branchiostoma floridae]|uniref:Uncharacterized protein LOC118431282 n=1 Tax=Branchiostoma floridae TaxID=7739 RepID=A0A9J7MC00_BRAFL|nr:uncharacterized protein LOC118431282 [Branchiostoma floridae]